MEIKPLNDRVLVLREEEEQRSAGGIIIPDTAKEKPQRGKVVAVGPGKIGEDGKRIPMEVSKGVKSALSFLRSIRLIDPTGGQTCDPRPASFSCARSRC